MFVLVLFRMNKLNTSNHRFVKRDRKMCLHKDLHAHLLLEHDFLNAVYKTEVGCSVFWPTLEYNFTQSFLEKNGTVLQILFVTLSSSKIYALFLQYNYVISLMFYQIA